MSRTIFARLHARFARPSAQRGGASAHPAAQAGPALSRREVLAASLAGSAGLLLPGSLLTRAAQARQPLPPKVTVAVVGAGLAGLAAAYELVTVGFDVVVYEARRSVGGRVLTFDNFVPGRFIEGGAELIGSNHPTWAAYAEKFGLTLEELDEPEGRLEPIHLNGQLLSDDQTERLYGEMSATLATLTERSASVNPDAPWDSPDAAALDAQSLEDWLNAQTCSDLAKRAIRIDLESTNAVPLAKASLLAMLSAIAGGGGNRYWTESETHRCRGGNQQLARKFLEAIGPQRVRFATPVSQVSVLAGDRAHVTAASGELEAYHACILAVPPSAWKHVRIEPAIPDAYRPQMGTAVKYLAHVKSRFWSDSQRAATTLSDGLLPQTWDGASARDPGTDTALIGFAGGPAAERARAVPPAERDAAFAADLAPRFPGFADARVKTRFMDWPAEVWNGTGYSFPAPGQVTKVGPILAKPYGPMVFAGEHCSTRFPGYMEGALQSGIKAAKVVYDALLPLYEGRAPQPPRSGTLPTVGPAPDAAQPTTPAGPRPTLPPQKP
jgi:monoamine oxidase